MTLMESGAAWINCGTAHAALFPPSAPVTTLVPLPNLAAKSTRIAKISRRIRLSKIASGVCPLHLHNRAPVKHPTTKPCVYSMRIRSMNLPGYSGRDV